MITSWETNIFEIREARQHAGNLRLTTGLETETGGRVKRIEKYIRGEEFFLTYGDGIADIEIRALYKFHRMARSFQEKPGTDGIVNGGFFVFRREFFRYLGEQGAMDTSKEVEALNRQWERGNHPWVVWDTGGSVGR